ncbi:MAG: hypothetical protein U0840_20765 [Gemmataceae bacterium]
MPPLLLRPCANAFLLALLAHGVFVTLLAWKEWRVHPDRTWSGFWKWWWFFARPVGVGMTVFGGSVFLLLSLILVSSHYSSSGISAVLMARALTAAAFIGIAFTIMPGLYVTNISIAFWQEEGRPSGNRFLVLWLRNLLWTTVALLGAVGVVCLVYWFTGVSPEAIKPLGTGLFWMATGLMGWWGSRIAIRRWREQHLDRVIQSARTGCSRAIRGASQASGISPDHAPESSPGAIQVIKDRITRIRHLRRGVTG